ncbi:MAG: inorganic diphosphatase [Chitinophagaceae bacterium]|nr:MAG: inorganic diphosphatase [Chitinophagaceae bacterium]
MDIIIETPALSPVKYKYEPELKAYRMLKALSPGLVFPYDFGFFPDTIGGDGDPLDVMVLSEFPSFPGCVISCRVIGCLQAEQSKKGGMIRNDRFLAVPDFSVQYGHVKSLEDLERNLVDAIELFFSNYLSAEGKKINWLPRLAAKEAAALLSKG